MEKTAPDKSWRHQLDKIRKIITRSRSRSNSPSSQNRAISVFSAGKIFHPHSSSNPHESPFKYLLVNISQKGTVIPVDSESVHALGYLVCECPKEEQFSQSEKNIVFISQPLTIPDTGPKGHFISSPYVLPDLTLAQTLTTKSWPLFYRLPLNLQHLENLKDVDTEALIGGILKDLSALTDPVGNEDVEHVYEALFNALLPQMPSSPASSNSRETSSREPQTVVDHTVETGFGLLSETESDNDGDDNHPQYPEQPLHHPSSTSHQKDKSLAILIHKEPQLDFWITPCGNHLPIITKKFIKKRMKPIIAEGVAGILIYQNQDTGELDFIKMDSNWLNEIKPELRYPVESFHHTSVTLVSSEVVKGQRRPSLSINLSQTISWVRAISTALFTNSLFHKCSTCYMDFVNPDRLKKHVNIQHPRSQRTRRNERRRDQPNYNHRAGPYAPISSSDDSGQEQISSPTQHHHHQRNLHQQEGILVNNVQVFTPKILDEFDCPSSYKTFWKLRNVERQLTRNEPPAERWVAPKFPLSLLSMETHVNYPGLLEQEFINYAKAYATLVKQNSWASVEGTGFYKVGVLNDASNLTVLGKGRILEDLRKQAPQLEDKNLSTLTESTLQTFFNQSRIYALTSSIPYDSWGEYFLTNQALGPEILSKVKDALAGFPTYKAVLRTLSTFIERIIVTLLPAQESFNDTEQRMLDQHRSHLLGPTPNIDYTRTKLQSDSRELVTKSPHFKQIQSHISDAEKRLLVEGMKVNLLFKVISNTSFEAKLHKLLIASDKYRQIESVPYNELLDNIQNLIIADRKSEIAFVNANRSPRPSLRTAMKRTTLRTPSPRIGSRQSSPVRRKSPSTRSPPRRSRNSTPSRQRSPSTSALQDRCDSCLKMHYPDYFCHGAKHCRVRHHQPPIRDTVSFQRRLDARDPDLFVMHDKCSQCKAVQQSKQGKTPWIQANNSTSQVAIPRNYFSQPFTLHPQSVTDIAQQLARMPPPPQQYWNAPTGPPYYPTPFQPPPHFQPGNSQNRSYSGDRGRQRSPAREQPFYGQHKQQDRHSGK